MKCPKCQAENPGTKQFCGDCGTSLNSSDQEPITKTLLTPAERLERGSTIAGKYRILEELGRGGMGVVYKAEDTKLKRTVALKFLPPELTHIPDVKERFIREAQAAAALDHPNICTVYEFDEDEEKSFISMAFIQGQNLKMKIESGPLELEEALRIATQVAEGLQEAHKKGIIHRDIKSANIMLDERKLAKIMDFGLARKTGGTLITKDGTTMGTVAYMSPEQARGEEVDLRTDIWSLGVVLYEIFTGQLPFQGERDQGVVYSILNEKPRPITELQSEIPVAIGQVVDKALEKDPDKRYQQIEELLDDLKSISAGIVPEEIKARLKKEKLRNRKRILLYAGAAGLIIIMAMLALTLFTGLAETIDSIAVLPLKNQTGDPEQDYFVDGVTDELIGQLAPISGLRKVISRTTVMKYKGEEKPLPDIARELNVEAVVEGTVYQIGDNMRIRLQLIDALPEERNLWAQTFTRPMTDVQAMYSEITRTILSEIKIRLTNDEEIRLASTRKVNPQAYEAYIKGLSYFYQLTPEDLVAALQYFESALEKDPNYALAHTGVSLVWIGRNQMGLAPPSEAMPRAKAAAQKASELDDTLAEVHYTQALIKTWMDWDWEGGEAEFRKAIELNPNYPDALVYYSNLLCFLGRSDEAIALSERAVELDPLNSLYLGISGNVLIHARRYDDAIERYQNVLRTSLNDPVGNGGLAQSYFKKGMYEEALRAQKAFLTGIGLSELGDVMAKTYEEAGYSEAMSFVGDTLTAISQETYISPYFISNFYVFAGKKDQTLELLEKGYNVRDPNMPGITEPCFDILRSDPRFQDLLRKMNLPADEKE